MARALKRLLGIFAVLVCVWAITLITLGGRSGKHAPPAPLADAANPVANDAGAVKPDHEEVYLSKITVYATRGMMAHGTIECVQELCAAVAGQIRNDGDRALKGVKVTASFPDKTGHTVYEHDYWLVSNDTDPLRPGFIRKFGYVVPECPSECVASKVTVKVAWVRFATS